MTKQELQVIKETENNLYWKIKEQEIRYGRNNEIYKLLLAKWSVVYELIKDLGIENKIL